MLPVTIALILASYGTGARVGTLDFAVDINSTTGSYMISLDGSPFLASAATEVTLAGVTYTTADDSLSLVSIAVNEGVDNLGPFKEHSMAWTTITSAKWGTNVRVYNDCVWFEQFWVGQGNTGTATTPDSLISSFPSFNTTVASDLGFLTFAGHQSGWAGAQAGRFGVDVPKVASSGLDAGPVVLFKEGGGSAAVISPFSHFMAYGSEWRGSDELRFGIHGEVTEVPQYFALKTIVSVGDGLHDAVRRWGGHLRGWYGKNQDPRAQDVTLRYLGYSTDNGAYYYYNLEPGTKNYDGTLKAVKAYADDISIPYRYVLLDSWWYYEGPHGGLKNWEPRPDVFPDGLNAFYNSTGWLVQAHNRYWSRDTVYAERGWPFLVDEHSNASVPASQEFWDSFFRNASVDIGGLRVYEQDWLDIEMEKMAVLRTSATMGREWLLQMGRAAAEHGLTVQYCMAYWRHLLQSIELPSVTQARASNDYHPGGDQWRLGLTSMLLHAIGLAPSKDNYWSTDVQPGNKWGNTTKEPHNRLQAAVSSLSTGPVATSDAIGMSDVDLIRKSCAADGLLLQPDRPAIAVEAQVHQMAFGAGGPSGEVWHTYSDVGGRRFHYVLAATLASDYALPLSDLEGIRDQQEYVVAEHNSTADVRRINGSGTLTLAACGRWDFQLYTLSPVEPNGFSVQGEVGKWVGMSRARFEEVSTTPLGMLLEAVGTPGEDITVAFIAPNNTQEITRCTITELGSVKLGTGGLCF